MSFGYVPLDQVPNSPLAQGSFSGLPSVDGNEAGSMVGNRMQDPRRLRKPRQIRALWRHGRTLAEYFAAGCH